MLISTSSDSSEHLQFSPLFGRAEHLECLGKPELEVVVEHLPPRQTMGSEAAGQCSEALISTCISTDLVKPKPWYTICVFLSGGGRP